MKRISQKIFILLLFAFIYSCVEDYQDANPPHLLDSPAVSSVDATSSLITDGSSAQITINVVDAPAGIDSIGYSIADENGDPVGTVTIDNLSSVKGQTKGQINATYTSEKNTAATVTISFAVFDKQFSEGEIVRKSSVPQSVQIEVVCESNLEGTYKTIVSGTSTDPGANMNPVTDLTSEVILKSTGTVGEYEISDASAGIYDAWYLGVYYGDPTPVPAILKDACGNVSITEYTGGPFGDSDGVDSSSGEVDQNGVITLSVTNVYGDEWTMTLTPK